MGTSMQFDGATGATPLIPSWLPEQDDSDVDFDQTRFAKPRREFTKFISSGGSEQQFLERAVAEYVSSSLGGSKIATQRMSTSVDAVSKFANFISGLNSRKFEEVVEEFNLSGLVGRNIHEVLVELFEEFCPNGGTLDEGIVRLGYERMVEDVIENKFGEVDKLDNDQLLFMFNKFISHTIEARIYCDLGRKSINLPDNIKIVERIQSQVLEFIYGSVCDAVSENENKIWSKTNNRFQSIVKKIYRNAFEFFENLIKEEA